MEGLLFADGVYPDFSLLKEVLYPLYFESDPCKVGGNVEKDWSKLLASAQYCDEPHGAAVGLKKSGISGCGSNVNPAEEAQTAQAVETALQCRRRSSRGGKKRSTNRSAVLKVDKWCLTRGNPKNVQLTGHRMTCMTQIPEPSIIYLLEESVKKLPKREHILEKDQFSQNSRTMFGECSKSPCLRNRHRISQSSSTFTSNAMEILNLINMKCTHLNKLGGKNEYRLETESEGRHDCLVLPKKTKHNVPSTDVVHLASNSEPDRKQLVDSEWGTPIKNGGPLPKEHSSVTSHGMLTAGRENYQTVEHSVINGPTEQGTCVMRTPRKQRTPTKSVEKLDPSFHGIEFQMHLCFEREKCDDCQLMVTSFFSRGRSRRKSTKSRLRFKSTSLSSGSEDDQTPASSSRNKRCASCKTQKTPLWRDAEDGTPLCNACGIRYKKYGMRCGQCWNIPKKDGKSCSRYCGCGGMFRAQT
ncbi:GATA-type zinc finger protein 1 [Mixophyes fleayi]|uniref:GATA-type zinc finger protein 1 n=1 Tax=Mixophyes fleayi TaxID=3061075 RepID=UPI003F4DAA8A